jgi:hypothetical protein
VTLVAFVFIVALLYMAPVPILFISAMIFMLSGLISGPRAWIRQRSLRRAA